MSTIWHVILVSTFGSLVGLSAGFLLLGNRERAVRLASYATPFAAGALLAAAFLDLMPEALEATPSRTVMIATLAGLLIFFTLEHFLHWFHHHHEHEDSQQPASTAPLIIIGDTLHNFIDGLAIGAAFLLDVQAGLVATIAVAAHEIPQEIGDIGLLLQKGMSRKSVIQVNIVSAMATAVGAVGVFLLGDALNVNMGILLGLVAGFFIYIAASDVIPEIHARDQSVIAGSGFAMLLLGLLVVGVITSFAHERLDGHEECRDIVSTTYAEICAPEHHHDS